MHYITLPDITLHRTHTCKGTDMQTYIYKNMHTCMHAYVRKYMPCHAMPCHAMPYTHTYIYIYIYIYMRVCAYIYIYVYIHIHNVHMRAHVYACKIRIHIDMRVPKDTLINMHT